MSDRLTKVFLVFTCALLMLSLWSDVASAQVKGGIMLFPSSGSKKTQEKSDKALPQIPKNLDQAQINEIVAGLNDDQVRRLLLQELEKAAAANVKKEQPKQATGLARIAQIAEENTTLFQTRLTDIRSGAVAVPEFLPKAYADLRGKGGTANILLMFVGVLAVLAAGVGAEWLFSRGTADMRKRLVTASARSLDGQNKASVLRSGP